MTDTDDTGYAPDLPTFDQIKEWAGTSISDDGDIHIVLAAITELRPRAEVERLRESERAIRPRMVGES